MQKGPLLRESESYKKDEPRAHPSFGMTVTFQEGVKSQIQKCWWQRAQSYFGMTPTQAQSRANKWKLVLILTS